MTDKEILKLFMDYVIMFGIVSTAKKLGISKPWIIERWLSKEIPIPRCYHFGIIQIATKAGII